MTHQTSWVRRGQMDVIVGLMGKNNYVAGTSRETTGMSFFSLEKKSVKFCIENQPIEPTIPALLTKNHNNKKKAYFKQRAALSKFKRNLIGTVFSYAE